MDLQIKLSSKLYAVDLRNPIDLSIPLDFNGSQPNTYNVPNATAKAYEDGTFVGDTRRGGSCNFEEYRLVPHCNGTHTEGVGHIALERISVHRIAPTGLIPATLITISPEAANTTSDTYVPQKGTGDFLLTRKNLENALRRQREYFHTALIIRTLPNDASKKSRRYMETPPPFFSFQAMEYINTRNVQHLLVDLPSIDRTFDEGKLSGHHTYWNVVQGSHDVDPTTHSLRTITEMIYVPMEVADGSYLLNLHVAPFVGDAAPSRPLLYLLQEL